MKIKLIKDIPPSLKAGEIADVTNRYAHELITNGTAEMAPEAKAKPASKAPRLTAEEQQGLIAIAKPKPKPAAKAKKK